jgi:hypothetical protein
MVYFTPAETGAWVRLTAHSDAARVTAFFHYRAQDNREPEGRRHLRWHCDSVRRQG